MADNTVTLETPRELERPALVGNNRSFAWITDKVSNIVEAPTPLWWWLAFIPGLAIMLTTLSANLFSSWLRTVTDPAQRWRLEARKTAK